MKAYQIKQYTPEEWDSIFEQGYENDSFSNHENEITLVWKDGAVCMDIQATGKRLVPILRKVENSLTLAGLAGNDGILAGWFGAWADSLTDSSEKRYFIWNYDGKHDAENGNWSYSWGIEQIDDDMWYIFLNLATASKLNR